MDRPRAAAARRRHAALRAGRIQTRLSAGRIPRRTHGRRGPAPAAHRPQLRLAAPDAQPHRAAPQREQRLLGADRSPSASHPHDPHGVLHLPRRPHRPHHRRHPAAQGPRGRRGPRHLRRGGVRRTHPPDAPRHAPGRHPRGSLRAARIPVVHAPRLPPQPPQNRRYGRPHRISGWHKYCKILPRRRLLGQVARRTSAPRRRHRRRPAAALSRRLGRTHRRKTGSRRPHGAPHGRRTTPHAAGMGRRGRVAADAGGGFRRRDRPRAADRPDLVALLHASSTHRASRPAAACACSS